MARWFGGDEWRPDGLGLLPGPLWPGSATPEGLCVDHPGALPSPPSGLIGLRECQAGAGQGRLPRSVWDFFPQWILMLVPISLTDSAYRLLAGPVRASIFPFLMNPPVPFRTILLLAAGACLVSCGREEPVRVYEVIVPPEARQPAAQPPMKMPSSGMPGMAPGAAGANQAGSASPGLEWTVPPGWEAQPLSALTNRGHYLLPESGGARAVVTISSYAGTAGGLAANVNRWRGQLGLPPQPDAEVEKSTVPLTAGSFTLQSVTLEGAKPDGTAAAMVGAILSQPDETWFFKLTGPKASAEAARPAFEAMLKSLKPGAPAPDGGLPASGTGVAPPAAPSTPKPGFTLPDGWKEQPASGMRAASFTIAGPGGLDADISVVHLSGDGGGDLQNVNLWRSQLGLPEITPADLAAQLKTEKLGQNEFRIFDGTTPAPIPQTENHGRIVAALASKGPDTWIVRARGEAKHLEAEMPNLRAFLAGLRLP